MRNGKDHFSSNNPGPGAQAPEPRNPETGRQNNQGFEGLTLTPGGNFLVVASAERDPPGWRHFAGDAADIPGSSITISPISTIRSWCASTSCRCRCSKTPTASSRVAAQSELLALDETLFLLLCRDSSNGYGTDGTDLALPQASSSSTRRSATNIAGSPYDGTVPVAPNGKLADGVVPATLTRLHRHQRQCGTEQVRIAQRRAQRPQ